MWGLGRCFSNDQNELRALRGNIQDKLSFRVGTRATPSDVQGFFMVLYSGISLSGAQGTTWCAVIKIMPFMPSYQGLCFLLSCFYLFVFFLFVYLLLVFFGGCKTSNAKGLLLALLRDHPWQI